MRENKITVGKVFGCFWPLLAAILCQLAVTMAGSFFIGAISVFLPGLVELTEDNVVTMVADAVLGLTAVATFVTLIMGAVWYQKYRPVQNLSLKQVVNPVLCVSLFFMGISMQLLISLCLSAIFPILPQKMTEEYSALIETLIGGNLWLSLLVTVVLAPLAEELIFRGVIFGKAKKIMPFMAANVVQAVLFGIYHMNLIQGVYAFVLGILLGVVAEYFHSIWASILLHAFVNGSAELLGLLPESLTETLGGIVLMAVVAVALLLISVKLFPSARTKCSENEKFSENSFDEP